MKKYRKKPIVIEAIQFTTENAEAAYTFVTCGKAAMHDDQGNMRIRIWSLEGSVYASLGDWIIKGVKGEFYPCKPDIFEMTYEEI